MAGQPTKYDEKYDSEIIEFFDIEPYYEHEEEYVGKDDKKWSKYVDKANDLPTLASFARHIKVSRDTLHEWSKVHPSFSDAIKRAKDLQENILVTNGLKGLYSTAFAIFTAKNIIGWKDRSDVTTNDKDIPTPIYGSKSVQPQ